MNTLSLLKCKMTFWFFLICYFVLLVPPVPRDLVVDVKFVDYKPIVKINWKVSVKYFVKQNSIA